MEKKTLRGDRNQCPTCLQYFNSSYAFEKHRTGDFASGRRCLTPEEMTKKGMFVSHDGFWRGSAMPTNVIVHKIENPSIE